MYRIKHKPTGLYYIPSREVRAPGWKSGYVKSNLSTMGKAYARRPSIKNIGERIYSHLAIKPPGQESSLYQRPKTVVIDAPAGDWEVEVMAGADQGVLSCQPQPAQPMSRKAPHSQ